MGFRHLSRTTNRTLTIGHTVVRSHTKDLVVNGPLNDLCTQEQRGWWGRWVGAVVDALVFKVPHWIVGHGLVRGGLLRLRVISDSRGRVLVFRRIRRKGTPGLSECRTVEPNFLHLITKTHTEAPTTVSSKGKTYQRGT